MSHTIDEILARIIDLLQECGWDSKAEWFTDRRDILRDSQPDADEFANAIRELDRATAGMGGFTDIPLTPKSDRITAQDARDQQWELAEALGNAIETLTTQ